MVLACHHITKTFLEESILSDVTFHINEHERVALVGVNGAGKTTLLRIITGELSADAGEITIAKDATIGYLPQEITYQSEHTIYEELLMVKENIIQIDKEMRTTELAMKDKTGDELEQLLKKYDTLQHTFEQEDGYAYKSQINGILQGLGFSHLDKDQPISTLSGGQKTRVMLGKLLLTSPDVLILDEPTNHLDLDSIVWLESYLSSYKGSVLIVSHDRYFLDRIVGKVVEIDRTKAITFTGNYTDYAKKKEELRVAEYHQYMNQQRDIKHQEEVIEKLRSFNREKSIKRAESRVKMLDKVERLQKPAGENRNMQFTLTPQVESGKDVLSIDGFSKSFGRNHLFSNLSFEVHRGEKVAILGRNGTGKTTLLKMILGEERVDAGYCRFGSNVEPGYYDQEHLQLTDGNDIFKEIQEDYPYLDHTEIRNVLAAFLFTGDDVFKSVSSLSGGEKGRVALAKLMLSNANLLLLDEPTNHLDIASREILESAIRDYTGTVIYVSHDRYFIDRTATRILDLTGEKLLSYDGDYSYYLEKKDTVEALHQIGAVQEDTSQSVSDTKSDWQQQKKQQANRRKLETQYEALEKRIEELDSVLASLDDELALPEHATNASKLIELTEKRESTNQELQEIWDELEILEQKLSEL